MIVQALVDLSQGKNPDQISPGDLANAGNANPFSAQFRMTASQTKLQIAGEKNALAGLDTAAGIVETLNRNFGDLIVSMQKFKSIVDGVSGTNAGRGLKAFFNMFGSGLNDVISGAQQVRGGGRPGYGGSFGGPRGGGNSFAGSSLVSAPFGMQDNSGIWASTGGKHMGTDFNVPVGTPIYATKDGFVSSDSIDKDYGNAVLIDHPDGYQSLYAHLSKKDVSPGTAVLKGQQIGLSGKSGNTTGPALHYEVRKGKNNPVNPSELSDAGSPVLSATGMMGTIKGAASGASLTSAPPKISGTTDENLMAVLQQAGFTGNALTNAYRVAKAESGGRSNALNPDASTGDYSMGLFQINMIGNLGKKRNEMYLSKYAGIGYTGPESLYDPLINAKIAYDISKGGTNWSDAWVNTSRKLNIGGGNPGYGASLPTTGSSNKNVYITVKIDQANETNAIAFANKIQELLDAKTNHELVGRS